MHFAYLKCAVERFWYIALLILKSYGEICILNLSFLQWGQGWSTGGGLPRPEVEQKTACWVSGPAQ